MSESSAETRSQLVRISYALLLIGLLTGGVTALVGAVIAVALFGWLLASEPGEDG